MFCWLNFYFPLLLELYNFVFSLQRLFIDIVWCIAFRDLVFACFRNGDGAGAAHLGDREEKQLFFGEGVRKWNS